MLPTKVTRTKRRKEDIPFEEFIRRRELEMKTAQNRVAVQSARRPQAYVRRDKIATATDKAKIKGFRSMREHWGVVLAKRDWKDAVKGLKKTPGGDPAHAYINHGRWSAVCPDPQCSGSETVDPDDPVFMCMSCGNVANKVQGIPRLRPVIFPSGDVTKEVTQPLLQRPRVNRNWYPTQEPDELWQENIEHYKELHPGSSIPMDVAKRLGLEDQDGMVSAE